MLHVDFETQSEVDITQAGAHRYAMDLSTTVLCMGWAQGDGAVELWLPGDPIPEPFFTEEIYAWNAQFERLIWWYVMENDHDAPHVPLEKFHCVAAQSRANGMPGKLELAARAMGSRQQKGDGMRLIRACCIPPYSENPTDYDQLYDYCKQDVRTERELSRGMRPLTARETLEYQVSERINDRGLRVDVPLARAALEYAADEQTELVDEFQELTGLAKIRGVRFTKWVYDRLDETLRPQMEKRVGGELRLSLDRSRREVLLAQPELDPLLHEALLLADLAQASSTSKFGAMVAGADLEDHRVRGTFIFNGASSTGRYSALRLQPQNMARDALKDPEPVARAICEGVDADTVCSWSGHGMMQTLKRLLRYAIQAAPGHVLVAGDWSAIEGRALPWLANNALAEKKLDAFRRGEDVYVTTAKDIFAGEIGDHERQVGKVAELALGYAGGIGAFQAMARGYGVAVSDDRAEIIKTIWRGKTNPWAEPFWDALERAAIHAVGSPGKVTSAGRIKYMFEPRLLGGSLLCLLPDGRMLTYPEARLDETINKFGMEQIQLSAMKGSWSPKAGEREWPRIRMWRGVLAENSCQATCASLLRELLVRLDETGLVAGHVHDEAILECLTADGDEVAAFLRTEMESGPEWAAGLPLAANVWVGERFRK